MTGQQLLLTLAVLAVIRWVVRAYFWPFSNCRRCLGTKVNRGSTRARFGVCKKCGGTGQRQVIGSKQVHKAVRSVIAARKDR